MKKETQSEKPSKNPWEPLNEMSERELNKYGTRAIINKRDSYNKRWGNA